MHITMSEAQAWIMIITAIGTAAAAIIAAIKATKTSTKSDEIHTIVNSSMTELRAKNDLLMSMMAAKDMEKVIAENARVNLAATTAAVQAHTAVATSAPMPIPSQIEIHKQVVEEQVVQRQLVEEPSRIIKAP